ncbi:MAG: methyltransferase family protein [Propionibacteriaceae bacterium]
MSREYAATETLRRTTLVALYGSYAATLSALAWAARRRSLPLPLPPRPAAVLGIGLGVTGAAIAVAGIGHLGSVAQVSGSEPEALVGAGLYRSSRNPQYLGLCALMAGAALASRSGLAAAVAGFGTAVLVHWIPNEERHLERVFGEDYRRYAAAVPRWVWPIGSLPAREPGFRPTRAPARRSARSG